MSLSKPYYRIARPKAFIPHYVENSRYASNRLQLSRAYINIDRKLRAIFNYVEPDEKNKSVFSLELYSLFLEACTEVELNCREILLANEINVKPENFNMKIYKKLEKSSLLSRYTAIFPNWRQRNEEGRLEYVRKEFQPFKNFNSSINKPLQWYQDYNAVKHNREENLEKANLENCINAVAAILILLYSQFGASCIEKYGPGQISYTTDDCEYDFVFGADVIFEIRPPKVGDWSLDELYEFEWDEIKDTPEPFVKFKFQ